MTSREKINFKLRREFQKESLKSSSPKNEVAELSGNLIIGPFRDFYAMTDFVISLRGQWHTKGLTPLAEVRSIVHRADV